MSGGRQVGRATTTAWSPTLKRLIALATVDAPHFKVGTSCRWKSPVEGASALRRRHRRPDAVFQPAAKDRYAANGVVLSSGEPFCG
jgi:glycine cleavage system aminomethyltransferase T